MKGIRDRYSNRVTSEVLSAHTRHDVLCPECFEPMVEITYVTVRGARDATAIRTVLSCGDERLCGHVVDA